MTEQLELLERQAHLAPVHPIAFVASGVQAASRKAEEGVSLVLAGDRRQRGEASSGRCAAGQGFVRHALGVLPGQYT
jgi:hypothetical protein